MGTHSEATITYDLKDKGHDYFSLYIGVDRERYGSVATVQYQVYLDGVKAYDSSVMKSTDIEFNIIDADLVVSATGQRPMGRLKFTIRYSDIIIKRHRL